MTRIYTQSLVAVVFAIVVSIGFTPVAHADYEGYDYSWDTGSGYDYSWDYGSDYDYSWDTGSAYDYSWDTGYGGTEYAYTGGNEYEYWPSTGTEYEYWPSTGTEYEYYPSGTEYEYYPSDYGYGSYDYGCGSSCGGGSWYTPSYSSGCGSWCGTGGGGYSTPRYIAPSSSSYYNSNTVSNTNVNNVTNIDNSINDSFNNYNSGNTSIVVSAPQTPTYTQPAPYCVINHAQYGGYGSGAYLSWSATNASSAYISQIGNVSLSGSQMVYGSGTYTMTVYGYNGQQATCATSIQGTYHPPVYQQPYVSLTQIPYTGFDFGPIGNAMYWVSLLGFAAAGAYLMVYYRGGALALATAMVPARKFQPIVAPKAPILVEREAALSATEVKVQPIVASLRKAAGTLDTMAIVASKDGSMPRIVIQRA